MEQVSYWRKGDSEQNFGDYLSEYLLNRLFLQTARRSVEIRIIGSILHDHLVPGEIDSDNISLDSGADVAPIPESRERLITWGCGIRERGGLSAENRKRIQILSVRGPISASDLALGAIPQGDPALLLPALYTPKRKRKFAEKATCIPHFLDRRPDEVLLSQSGCDLVLRPNIPSGESFIEQFIDAVVSSRFVLSASLHGAIVAAAYGRPFAFWNPGVIDLPTKWMDFAASIGIPEGFVPDLTQGLSHFKDHIAPHIKIPSLWEALTFAPYPLRADAVLKVLRHELRPIADSKLKAALASRIKLFERQHPRFASIAAESRNEVATLAARVRNLGEALAQLRADAEVHTLSLDKAQRELAVAHQKIAVLVKVLDNRVREMETSAIWRMSEPIRRVSSRFPRIKREVRRALKAAWLVVSRRRD
jgi:polysaccharide pyruvyl transferase